MIKESEAIGFSKLGIMFFNQFAIQCGGFAEVGVDLEHVSATLVEVADQTRRAEIPFRTGQAAGK